MTQQYADDAIWHDQILPNMFNDSRFHRYEKYRRYAELDGIKAGVVIASRNPPYTTNFVLNKSDNDRLMAAKRSGPLHKAFIVEAIIEKDGTMTFVASFNAEQFNAEMLPNLSLRPGQFGPFWLLPSDPDHEPF
jgi:hypothetical protein